MRRLVRIFSQSLGIVALSAALALGVNALRPDGLPYVQAAQQSAVQLSPAASEIALKDAALLFLSGRAVFLDARSQFEFEQGHIQGAISLPPREFAAQFQDIKPRLAGKEAVITYCDGDRCPLSHALAEHLRGAGIKNVYVLKNGWTLWQTEKLPVAKGSAAPQAAAAPAPAPKAMSTAAPKAQPKPAAQGGICRDCGAK